MTIIVLLQMYLKSSFAKNYTNIIIFYKLKTYKIETYLNIQTKICLKCNYRYLKQSSYKWWNKQFS